MLRAVQLIVLHTEHPDALVSFYRALGLDLAPERHGRGPEHYSGVLGEVVFEIYPARAGAETPRAVSFGFTTHDLEHTITTARAAGGACIRQRADHAILADPAGHRFFITEHAA